jgi:hypothetical protein
MQSHKESEARERVCGSVSVAENDPKNCVEKISTGANTLELKHN